MNPDPNLPVWVLYVYTLFFLVVWISVSNKTGKNFRLFSMAFGFALPLLIIGGLLLGSNYPNSILLLSSVVDTTAPDGSEINSLSDRITTILGVFLTIIFVLLQSDYQELMDNTLRARSSATVKYAFLMKKNCMLLFFVVASFVSIYALFVTSILSKVYESQAFVFAQVDEFQIFSLVLIAVVLVFYVWRDDELGGGDLEEDVDDGENSNSGDQDIKETAQPAAGKNNGAEQKRTRKKGNASRSLIELTGLHLNQCVQCAASYLNISRAFASSLAGLAVVVVLQAYSATTGVVAAAAGVSIFLVTMFGFVINDIYDLEKDQKGGRIDKILVRGQLGQREVRIVALSWLLLSWAVSLIFLNTSSFLILVTLAIALTVYSPFSKALPALKGVYTALLCMSPALFLNIVAGDQIIGIQYITIGFAYFVGREIVIDTGDRTADILSGTKTLAVILGQKWGIALETAIMGISLISLIFLVEGSARSVVSLGLALTLIVGYLVNQDTRLSTSLTRIPIVVGMIAVLGI